MVSEFLNNTGHLSCRLPSKNGKYQQRNENSEKKKNQMEDLKHCNWYKKITGWAHKNNGGAEGNVSKLDDRSIKMIKGEERREKTLQKRTEKTVIELQEPVWHHENV